MPFDDLKYALGSGQPLIVVRTREQAEPFRDDLNEMCLEFGRQTAQVIHIKEAPWELLRYTPSGGLRRLVRARNSNEKDKWVTCCPPGIQINGVVEFMLGREPELNTPQQPQQAPQPQKQLPFEVPCVIHMEEPQLWWAGMSQYALRQLAVSFKGVNQAMVLTVPPGTEVPESLVPYATVLDQPPPEQEDIELLVVDTMDQSSWFSQRAEADPVVASEQRSQLIRVLRGLTIGHAEAALTEGLTRVRDSRTWSRIKDDPQALWKFVITETRAWKSRQAQSGGRIALMDLSDYHELAGWDFLRAEIMRLKDAGAFEPGHPLFPRMFVFMGLPGGGKSAAVALMGLWTGLPVYDTNAASMSGTGILGSMENQFAGTLRDAETVAPCILRFDEFEKTIGGAASSNRSDGGSLNRATQILLKWTQERARKIGVLVAATMNSSDVRPEDVRSGRSEGTYFVDIPDAAIRKGAATILLMHLLSKTNAWNRVKGLPNVVVASDVTPQWVASQTNDWMPAEIELLLDKALVNGGGRVITQEGLLLAKGSIVPLTKFMPEKVAALRQMGKAIPSVAYGYGGGVVGVPRRRRGTLPADSKATTGGEDPGGSGSVKSVGTQQVRVEE